MGRKFVGVDGPARSRSRRGDQPRLCEHVFVTSKGSAYARFRRSLDNGNVTAALSAAAELPTVTLIDSLEVCRLLALTKDRRYPRAAARWVRRLLDEGATLEDAQLAGASLAHLRAEPEAGLAWETLVRLCERHQAPPVGH